MTDYIVQDTGLEITSDWTLDRAAQIIEGLRQGKDSATWAIADALVYANDKFNDDIYQYLDDTNWSSSTISNYMTTARRIPRAVRRATVSFSNHSELTADYLTEAQRMDALDKLESKEWTRADLREWKRSIKGDDTPEEQTITLQHKQIVQDKTNGLIVVFVPPHEDFDIMEFKAVVRKRKPQAEDNAA